MRETVIFMIFQYDLFDAVGALSWWTFTSHLQPQSRRGTTSVETGQGSIVTGRKIDTLLITLWLTHCRRTCLKRWVWKIPCEINVILTRVNSYFPRCVSASDGWRRNLHQNHLYLLQQKHHPSSHQGAETKSESLSGETRYIQCRKGLNSYNMT